MMATFPSPVWTMAAAAESVDWAITAVLIPTCSIEAKESAADWKITVAPVSAISIAEAMSATPEEVSIASAAKEEKEAMAAKATINLDAIFIVYPKKIFQIDDQN